MKPPFGTLNATIAKAVTANAPRRYDSIIEPFGDGGTYALTLEKRRPRRHLVNVRDEVRVAALTAAQQLTSGEMQRLRRMEWTSSPEAFTAALAITATEGVEFLYRYLYLKKLGMRGPDPDSPPMYDVLSMGADVSDVLQGLPLMRVALKGVELVSEEPQQTMAGAGGGSYLVLLPQTPEEADAVEGRISSLSGPFFFMRKVVTDTDVIDRAKAYSSLRVAGQKVASIMMASYAVVTNVANRRGITPIDPSALEGMSMEAA